MAVKKSKPKAEPKAEKNEAAVADERAFCGFHVARDRHDVFRRLLAEEGREAAPVLRMFVDAYAAGRVTFQHLKDGVKS